MRLIVSYWYWYYVGKEYLLWSSNTLQKKKNNVPIFEKRNVFLWEEENLSRSLCSTNSSIALSRLKTVQNQANQTSKILRHTFWLLNESNNTRIKENFNLVDGTNLCWTVCNSEKWKVCDSLKIWGRPSMWLPTSVALLTHKLPLTPQQRKMLLGYLTKNESAASFLWVPIKKTD